MYSTAYTCPERKWDTKEFEKIKTRGRLNQVSGRNELAGEIEEGSLGLGTEIEKGKKKWGESGKTAAGQLVGVQSTKCLDSGKIANRGHRV